MEINMTLQVAVAFLCGVLATFVPMWAFMKRLRRTILCLRNEGDYNFMRFRLMYKTAHSRNQAEFDNCPELKKLTKQYYANEAHIKRKYGEEK